MSKPRVFISSTFYDLRYVRSSLEGFVSQLGYDAVLSEKGRIAYDPDIPLDESCYREATTADMLVLIIGGRYGSAASHEKIEGTPDFYDRYESITRKEYDAAHKRDIPVYVLVEKAVFSEYQTYKKNKDNSSIQYAHVDSINVFKLVDEILSKARNNPVYQFDQPDEIEAWLKEQWAGLFRELINRRSEQKQLTSLTDKIAEMSSINSSMQRYMEEIVSRVVKSPEEATALIETEKQRQLSEKTLRDLDKIEVFSELHNIFDIDKKDAVNAYRAATSIDDLARRISSLSPEIEKERAISHWKKNPIIVDSINEVRNLLGNSNINFLENPGAKNA